MKNLYFTALLTVITFGSVLSQTTLYSETFTGQNGKGASRGIFGGTNTDTSGVNWTIDISNTSLDGIGFFGNGDYFFVANEIFQSKDTDGNAFWFSPSIPISGYTNVSFSLNAISHCSLASILFLPVPHARGISGVIFSTAMYLIMFHCPCFVVNLFSII